MIEQPSETSATERFLRAFHDQHAGATAHAFSALPAMRAARVFESTYASLLDEVLPQPPTAIVLDLACGDGHLLSLLAGEADARLVGVDFSEGELAAARRRLGARAELHWGRAQALPLEAGSVDVVICHLALMLMESVDVVLAEVLRVLRRRGRFVGVVATAQPPQPALDAYRALLARHPRRSDAQDVRFGDPRLRSAAGLKALLERDFDSVCCDEVALSRRLTAEELWQWFSGMYDVHLLNPADRADVANQLTEALRPLCEFDGRIAYRETLLQFSARTRLPGALPRPQDDG